MSATAEFPPRKESHQWNLTERAGFKTATVLLAAGLTLALTGCAGSGAEIPDTKFFVIDYTVPIEKNSKEVLPVSVGVDRFRSDAIYRTDRIIYRKVPFRLDYYPYERWAARPDEIVTDRMIDHLTAKQRFVEVVRATAGLNVDYLVRGRVKRFEEVDRNEGYSAYAQIEVYVIHRRTGKVLFQKQIAQSKLAKSKPPQGFVDAMAENLKGLLDQASSRVVEAIEAHQASLNSRP